MNYFCILVVVGGARGWTATGGIRFIGVDAAAAAATGGTATTSTGATTTTRAAAVVATGAVAVAVAQPIFGVSTAAAAAIRWWCRSWIWMNPNEGGHGSTMDDGWCRQW